MRNKILLLSIVISALVFTRCTESYIEDMNSSPNSTGAVLNANLLTTAEVSVFGNVTGELARTASVWMQSQAGISNQTLDEIAMYQALEGDNTNDWNSLYTGWMETADNLVNQAGEENPYYKGIGMILKAWSGAYISDIWGDVPFSEGIQADGNLNPKYDTQEEIYTSVQQMLSDAIVLLKKSPDSNVEVPGADDLMLEGEIESWVKLAWMLKARYANRLSKKDATGSADQVLSHLENASLVGISDNVYAKFGETANNANQWYAFYLQRKSYMAMGEYFVERLKANNDPRLAFYAAKNKDDKYIGSPADTRELNLEASMIGSYLNGSALPVPLITYEEYMFLKSEAYLRKGDKDKAKECYMDGIKASIKSVTGEDASESVISVYEALIEDDINLELIIEAKYDALFTQVEVWTDWRRTGYPTLTANPDPRADSKGIPLRLPTTIDERTYNTSAVIVSDKYEKVWFAQ